MTSNFKSPYNKLLDEVFSIAVNDYLKARDIEGYVTKEAKRLYEDSLSRSTYSNSGTGEPVNEQRRIFLERANPLLEQQYKKSFGDIEVLNALKRQSSEKTPYEQAMEKYLQGGK